jgi:molybdopterin converting factor small subunit
MKITVHYRTQIRRAVGVSSETIDLAAGLSVPDLLQRLAECHGDAFRRLVLPEGKPARGSVLVFVGDTQVPHPTQAMALKDGDAVTLLAPMSGG